MNNLNGFRIWDKKEKKMYYSNTGKNIFVIDSGGNLLKATKIKEHFEYKIELIPGYEADNRYIVMMMLDRKDRSFFNVYEGDILQYASGFKFVVAFGTHPSFCPGDQMDTTNEGFCALVYEDGKVQTNNFNCYPLSDIENLAFKIGNIYEGILYKQKEE